MDDVMQALQMLKNLVIALLRAVFFRERGFCHIFFTCYKSKSQI